MNFDAETISFICLQNPFHMFNIDNFVFMIGRLWYHFFNISLESDNLNSPGSDLNWALVMSLM